MQPCPASTHGVGNGADRFFLPDDTPVQLVFEVQQFVALALHHFADGDARPARHDVGDIFAVYLLLDHRRSTLHLAQLRLDSCVLFFLGFDLTVAYLGHLPVIAFALGTLSLIFQRLDVDLVLLNPVDQILFALPASQLLFLVFLQVGDLFA